MYSVYTVPDSPAESALVRRKRAACGKGRRPPWSPRTRPLLGGRVRLSGSLPWRDLGSSTCYKLTLWWLLGSLGQWSAVLASSEPGDAFYHSSAYSWVHLMNGAVANTWPVLCTSCLCINSYLVDPASSHMLVSKIKPCMSKYKL